MLSEDAILKLKHFKKAQGFKTNGEMLTHLANEYIRKNMTLFPNQGQLAAETTPGR
jgi:hypothetical protein